MGKAPPLLLDPGERLERLEAAGVAVTVVQHFDEALRQTPYDAFVERIRARVALTGFLMTPDAAFGFERRGTPATLAELGQRDGFDVVVVPPFTLDGQEVRSSTIRDADRGRRPGDGGAPARPARHAHGVDRRRGRRTHPARLPAARSPCRPTATTRPRSTGGRSSFGSCGGDAYLLGEISNRRVTVDPRRRPERPSAAEDLRGRVRVLPARSGRLVEPVACLPGGFTGLVVALAARFAAIVPRRGLSRVRLRRVGRWRADEQSGDLRQDRHQVPAPRAVRRRRARGSRSAPSRTARRTAG